MSDFETWFAQFRERVHGWQADEVKTWLEAAWDAASAQDAPANSIPPGTAAWAGNAGISASEFMALPLEKRRKILDMACERLHEEQS